MKTYRLTDWLPSTKKEMEIRGWDCLDVILFSGDAYVDHPSFGAAVIGRILEAEGLRVGIVPQPDWRGDYRDFKKLGTPRLFFGVSPGAMDSMVNHYTANKRLRSDDAYSPNHQPELAIKTKRHNFHLEQVQDFTPTPMTVATEIFYTGFHPYTLEKLECARTKEEKLAQRQFFFWYQPEFRSRIMRYLRSIKKNDLIQKLSKG